MSAPLLVARDVARVFGGGRLLVGRRRPLARAVDGVSLDVPRGRTVGVVGESGSGKSTLARMMVGLLAPTAGEIELEGRSVPELARRDRRALHRKAQMVDEPVSALDVSIQAQVLKLLADLQARLKLTYVFISHDLAVIEMISDEVAVMYQGKVVERGSREQIFEAPRHDYTRLLLASAPGSRRAAQR